MPNTLRFVLRLVPHPYPQSPGADGEAWGEAALSWQADAVRVPLLETQWDLLPLAEWFADSRDNLCHETWSPDDPAWAPYPGESLTQALQRSQARLFSEAEKEAEERWQEKIFAFRQTHSLRFALPGAKIPAILIGCNHGAGEVSGAGDIPWSYAFALQDFCREMLRTLHPILTKWQERTSSAPARKRADQALARLEETSSSGG